MVRLSIQQKVGEDISHILQSFIRNKANILTSICLFPVEGLYSFQGDYQGSSLEVCHQPKQHFRQAITENAQEIVQGNKEENNVSDTMESDWHQVSNSMPIQNSQVIYKNSHPPS